MALPVAPSNQQAFNSAVANNNISSMRGPALLARYQPGIDAARAADTAKNTAAAAALRAQLGIGVPNPAQQAANAAARAAASAEAQRVAALRGQIGLGQENALSTANSGINGYANQYRQNSQNAVNALRSGQDTINRTRENTALNTRRGIAGVTAGVRQGLQGATTALPDSALDSGATGALARSWAKLGQQQAAGVYNEAALANRDADFQQVDLDRQRRQQEENFGIEKQAQVQSISDQLYRDLRTLDGQAQAGGINGAVNYALKDNVINNAIARLNQLDQQRQAELGGVQALGADQIQANAIALDQAGAAAYNPFTIPEAATGTVEGPAVAQLPIYTRRRDI